MEDATLGVINGDGDGDGYGYGYGNCFDNGSGDGYGYGYGNCFDNGNGFGDGDGIQVINIPKRQAWISFHYIKKSSNDGRYVLRNLKEVAKGEVLSEHKIKMCEYGLHASLSPKDAQKYMPYNSVLTKVKVWGKLICQQDKLVATHRQIVEEVLKGVKL